MIPLTHPSIIICGATSGIGHALSRQLARASSKPSMHLVGRNAAAAQDLITSLKQDNPSGTYQFHQCDLTLVSETKALVQTLRGAVDSVDVLICSQGILSTAGRTETIEGNDVKMMLHYYSRMLVIDGLKDKLSENARVMSVLDSLRGGPKTVKWDDLDLKQNFSLNNAAQHCMTMTDIALQDLGERLPNVKLFHSYPGIVKTNLFQGLSWPMRVGASLIAQVMAVTPEVCAERLSQALLTEQPEQYKAGEALFCDSKGLPVKGKHIATQEERQKVWEHTMKIIG